MIGILYLSVSLSITYLGISHFKMVLISDASGCVTLPLWTPEQPPLGSPGDKQVPL